MAGLFNGQVHEAYQLLWCSLQQQQQQDNAGQVLLPSIAGGVYCPVLSCPALRCAVLIPWSPGHEMGAVLET